MYRLLEPATRDPFYALILLLGFALIVALVVKGIGAIGHAANTKVCAACTSRVPIAATKCKHCGSALN